MVDDIQKYLNDWKAILKIEKSPFTSLNYYNRIQKWFVPYLQSINKNLTQLTTKDIFEFREYLLKKGLKFRLINSILVALKSFWNYLVQKEIVQNIMPARGLQVKAPLGLPQPVNEEDIQKIFRGIRPSDKELWFVLCMGFFAGLRIGEILQLTKEDFSIEEKMIKVHIRKGKGNKERYTLILPFPNVYKIVLNYIKGFQSNEKIVKSSYFSIEKRIATLSDRTGVKTIGGLPFTIHKARHTFATLCVDRFGMSYDDVAELMGHSDTKTTKLYGKKELKTIAKDLFLKYHQAKEE